MLNFDVSDTSLMCTENNLLQSGQCNHEVVKGIIKFLKLVSKTPNNKTGGNNHGLRIQSFAGTTQYFFYM